MCKKQNQCDGDPPINLIHQLLDQIQDTAGEARPVDIRVGAHWTIAVFDARGRRRAGLASTLGGGDHHHRGQPPVRDAGQLLPYTPMDLATLACSESVTEASIGLASINALLDVDESACVKVNAADVIAERGAGRTIAIVGHFPFVPRLRSIAGALHVLELNPREGDLPAGRAADVLPQADVVAITGTSLLNHTFEGLMALCREETFVIVLGGTTPLSSKLFDMGVDAIAGTRLVDIEAAALAVSQGATFPQIPGKRLLTMLRQS